MVQLCSRLYSNVTFVGAHDSYAVGVNNCRLAIPAYAIHFPLLKIPPIWRFPVATNQDQNGKYRSLGRPTYYGSSILLVSVFSDYPARRWHPHAASPSAHQ
jgi:hypothetical protein